MKWLDKYKDSKVITDPRGQWAHPGKITRIPSNKITMQGVPYPVYGISDTGDTQMMYPGQDYSFDGSSVTEYPMMQTGGMTGYEDPDYVTGVTKGAYNKINKFTESFIPVKVINHATALAEKQGYDYGESSDGPLDAVRHASAAASAAARTYVPKVITEYLPALDKAIRVTNANALGVLHELVNPNANGFWMDLKNNYKGSLIGAIPGLNDKQRNQSVINELKNKKLTVNNYKKEKGGQANWLDKYN